MVESKRSWEMILLLWSGITIIFCLRVNMSVAAQSMREELRWSEAQKGLVLSSFYWGYAVGQIPASKIAQYYGAKFLFGGSILTASLLTLLVPIACRHSFETSLLVRALIGLAESGAFPSCYYFFPKWIPINEKTIMIATFMSGSYLGNSLGFSISGMIIGGHFSFLWITLTGGWPVIFYFFGVVGIAWLPLWIYFAYETPEEHPEITEDELEYLNRGKGEHTHRLEDSSLSSPPATTYYPVSPTAQRKSVGTDSYEMEDAALLPTVGNLNLSTMLDVPPSAANPYSAAAVAERREVARRTPWTAFLTHPASLVILCAQWVASWTNYMLMSEIPSFLTDDLGFRLESAGILSVAPYLGQFISTIMFGFIFDKCQTRFGWKTRTVRQVAQYISMAGSGGLLVCCGFASSPSVAVIFLILALFCFGASQSGVACAYLDVAPNYSAVLHALGLAIGSIAGMMSPLVVAYCTSMWPGAWGWRIVFLLTAGQGALSLVAWTIFQTSDIVPALNQPSSQSAKRIN